MSDLSEKDSSSVSDTVWLSAELYTLQFGLKLKFPSNLAAMSENEVELFTSSNIIFKRLKNVHYTKLTQVDEGQSARVQQRPEVDS